MALLSERKTVLNDWADIFSQLSKHSSSALLMKLDVALIGLSFDKLPRCEEYRPLLVCYPLWKSSYKENMLIPVFVHEIHNKKQLQLDIPYERHQYLFPEAATCIKETVGMVLKEQVFVKDISNLLDDIFSSILVKNNPFAQYRLLEYKIAIALFFDNKQLLDNLKSDIEARAKIWEPVRFERVFNKTVQKWRDDLFEKIDNRELFIEQIRSNLLNKKIASLKESHMVQ